MVPPNSNFWSISRKESLEYQEKYALWNRFLRILLCSNDILNPGHNQQLLNRKRTSLLDNVCYNYEQLFDPVQCTACKRRQVSSIGKPVVSRPTSILTFSDKFHYLSGTNCFGNGTWQNLACLYQSSNLHILFVCHHILSILGKKFFFRLNLFNVWQLLHFNYS